jgi:hypothetical protein
VRLSQPQPSATPTHSLGPVTASSQRPTKPWKDRRGVRPLSQPHQERRWHRHVLPRTLAFVLVSCVACAPSRLMSSFNPHTRHRCAAGQHLGAGSLPRARPVSQTSFVSAALTLVQREPRRRRETQGAGIVSMHACLVGVDRHHLCWHSPSYAPRARRSSA